MKKVVTILTVTILLMGVRSFAAAPKTNHVPEDLDLVCLDASHEDLVIYHISVSAERLVGIPENLPPANAYTGEYIAIVETINLEQNLFKTLYTGTKEFSITQVEPDLYHFHSTKLNIDLKCNPNRLNHGGGGFSGSN